MREMEDCLKGLMMVVEWLDMMHFCTGGGMVGEDAWQRHCIECGFMQCNYNALPPTSTVQLLFTLQSVQVLSFRSFLMFFYICLLSNIILFSL